MPIMDSYEAIKRVRSQKTFQGLSIIALTAKAMVGDRVKCLQAGANYYMNKPVNIEELLVLLKVLMAQGNIKGYRYGEYWVRYTDKYDTIYLSIDVYYHY